MQKIIIIFISIFTITSGEGLIENLDNRFDSKLELTNLSDYSLLSDPIDYQSKIYSLKPMIASLALPGLGQYLNHSPWWKTAIFAGVEIAGIAGYVTWTNKADDITREYENWADEHWDMKTWVNGSAVLLSDIQSGGFPDVSDVRIDGSHHMLLQLIDGSYVSSDILATNPNFVYKVELRDWDFYEGIGKYDQFVAGWDDAKSNWEIVHKNIKDGEDELIVMTPNKKHYLDLRNDSNIFYKNAKFAVSTILFNHIFSALDALWSANKNKELSYKLDVSIGSKSNYEIKGISVQWNL